jgi:hypothetical protein
MTMRDEPTIAGGIEALKGRFRPLQAVSGSEPVFLLSAGWRSGSTLVQRLLVSGGGLLMWGEPYDHCSLIQRLADSLRPFSEPWPPGRPRGEWPPDAYMVDPSDPPRPDRWIANAYPHPANLMAAHRAFFDRLFSEPAAAAGFRRWGVKEVRLGGEHAAYLRALYPDARILFLHRNPWDAWASYRRRHDERPSAYWWYHRWPDEEVSTAAHFASIWHRLTDSFLAWAPTLGAHLVAYESVVRGSGLEGLSAAAGVEVDRRVLDLRIGGSSADRTRQSPMTDDDQRSIGEVAGAMARMLGYLGPTEGGSGPGGMR